jgi:hypothetical protein
MGPDPARVRLSRRDQGAAVSDDTPYITPQMLYSYLRQLSDGDPLRFQQEFEKLAREMERIRREHDRRASAELAKRISHAIARH